MDECHIWDNRYVWHKDWPLKMFIGQWPIFLGQVILLNILKIVWWRNIILGIMDQCDTKIGLIKYMWVSDLHTCHTSHCEIKSHRIWPILQHILWRNKHTSHFVVFITNFINYNKGFWLFWGSFKVAFVKISQNFINSHWKICLILQTSVHSLWHVWITCSSWSSDFALYLKGELLLLIILMYLIMAPARGIRAPWYLL